MKISDIINKILSKIRFVFTGYCDENQRKQILHYNYLKEHGVDCKLGSVYLGGMPIINKFPGSQIKLGNNIILYSKSEYNHAGINHPVILSTMKENALIDIKDNCGFSGTSIVSVKHIEIGENSMFGVNTNIYDTDFHSTDINQRINNKTFDIKDVSSEIIIGKNVWVGANSTILKGVRIGDNSIIAAFSLVNKDVPANVLFGGVPAKFIRTLEN